ncbi:MAG: hypothetical protein ACNS60_10060 [Candidatus Cyclobacteriaceae bacterium M2_1C_046]
MMTRKAIIDKTIEILHRLPDAELDQVYKFTDFLRKQIDDEIIIKGSAELMKNSNSLNFLNDEEELYTRADLKEKFK